MQALWDAIADHGVDFVACGIFGLIGLWVKKILNAVTKGIDDLSEMIGNIRKMSMASTQDRIVYLVGSYKKRGYVTMREKAIIKDMYEPYKAEGGNSHAKEAIAELEKLDVRED